MKIFLLGIKTACFEVENRNELYVETAKCLNGDCTLRMISGEEVSEGEEKMENDKIQYGKNILNNEKLWASAEQ